MCIEAVAWAFKQNVRPSSLKFVLVALADCANTNEDMALWPSIKHIEHLTGLNDKTIKRYLVHLKSMGLLQDTGKRTGKTRQIKVYRLMFENEPKNGPLKESRFSLEREPKTGPLKGPKNGLRNSYDQTLKEPDSKGMEKRKEDGSNKSIEKNTVTVSPEAIERVKVLAPGYTVEFLLEGFTQTCRRGQWPKYPDPAFEAWVAKYLANVAESGARRKSPGGGYQPPGVDDREVNPHSGANMWVKRLSGWRREGWWQPGWGPKPDHPGCLAPPSLLESILKIPASKSSPPQTRSQHA